MAKGISKYDQKRAAEAAQNSKRTVVVGEGDSWASIAADLGMPRSLLEIAKANGGVNLRPGMVIKIPRLSKNPFISNEQAVNMGMGTSQQVQAAYAAGGTGKDLYAGGKFAGAFNMQGQPTGGIKAPGMGTAGVPAGWQTGPNAWQRPEDMGNLPTTKPAFQNTLMPTGAFQTPLMGGQAPTQAAGTPRPPQPGTQGMQYQGAAGGTVQGGIETRSQFQRDVTEAVTGVPKFIAGMAGTAAAQIPPGLGNIPKNVLGLIPRPVIPLDAARQVQQYFTPPGVVQPPVPGQPATPSTQSAASIMDVKFTEMTIGAANQLAAAANDPSIPPPQLNSEVVKRMALISGDSVQKVTQDLAEAFGYVYNPASMTYNTPLQGAQQYGVPNLNLNVPAAMSGAPTAHIVNPGQQSGGYMTPKGYFVPYNRYPKQAGGTSGGGYGGGGGGYRGGGGPTAQAPQGLAGGDYQLTTGTRQNRFY